MKKILSIILLVFIISTSSVFASDEIVVSRPATPSVVSEYGEITEAGNGYIVVKTRNMGEVRFNIDDSTYIISAETVLPMDISKRKTDKVAVYHSAAMTKSLPPQSYAYAVIGDITTELGNPIYTVAEKVEQGKDGIMITTDAGNTIVTVQATASVKPYLTKNIVKLSDIKEGSKLLLWYDAVTLSIPSYATSDKVVILSDGDEELTINDVKIKLADDEKVYENEGGKFLPLRTIAEALGCEVLWNNDERCATVKKGDFSSSIYVTDGNAAVRSKSAEAFSGVLYGSKTYVNEAFFVSIR